MPRFAHFAVFAILLAPTVALAGHPCQFQAQRKLDLDLNGVRIVQFDVRSHELHVSGSADAKGLSLDGHACASDQKSLDALTVSQTRDGDRLIVTLGSEAHFNLNLWHSQYADLDVNVHLPARMPVEVRVGSGDAEVRNVASVDATVGSGGIKVYDLAGSFHGQVGSGDIHIERVASVTIDSVGSGDLKASDIRGDARVDVIGSGNADLSKIAGNVQVGAIGSGDLHVDGVGGNLVVQTKGSGDVEHNHVTGSVKLPAERD